MTPGNRQLTVLEWCQIQQKHDVLKDEEENFTSR